MAEQNPYVTVDMPAEGTGSFAFWQGEAQRAKDALARLADERKWDENVQAYLGKSLDALPSDDTVTVPKDYANVEQKKALLFFQVPEVTLTAEQPGLEDAVRVFQAVLNRKLRSDEINAGALMDEVLMDVLCPAGIGASKIGYEAEVEGTVEVMQPAMDPNGQPIVDPLTGQPAMMPVQVPNIVNERYFWERIPIKRLLVPPDFSGADFDKAPWLGFSFEQDRAVVARRYQLEEDALKPAGADGEGRVQGDVQMDDASQARPRVRGIEVWYRAALYRDDVANSECLYQLVWFEGMDAPVVHRPSPYQVKENGRIVAGMRGFPIHVLTLRYVSDQAIPPSDVGVTRELVDELSLGRTQMVQQRRRTTPLVMYDPTRVDKTTIDKIEQGETQGFIAATGGIDAANPGMMEVRRAQFPRENFEFARVITTDLQEAWALGSNQQGTQTDTRRTATELSIIASATQTRMKREQTQVARWFISGVQKLGALIQLFADEPDYVEIVGENGLRSLQQWDRTQIQGRFAYSAKPDSQLQMDAAMDRKQAMDEYQFLRKDPLVNPQTLLTKVARRLGYEPAQFLAQPQPPRPQPPQPSFSFKGEDLNPAMPQFPIVVEILQQGGVQISPQALMAAQQQATMQTLAAQATGAALAEGDPQHGGLAEKVHPLSKHQADETGKLPGNGQAAAQ